MGILSLYSDRIEESVQRGLTSPAPQADPSFRTFSFMALGMSGAATGLLEQGASFLEGIGNFNALGNRRFAEMGAKTAEPERVKERQRGLDAAARATRMRAQESSPDPQTTHVADQIFHGLTRFGVKAVGSVLAAGPVGGAALLGTEETNTIYRDLTMRGIDSETALKVAAVQGAISAAGVVLPVSGAGMAATTAGKVGATAGLVAAGGPGAYVAQETLARDILQRAGYADEAGKHDPADPLGLALSTILPAAFGAVSLRGALRTPKQIGPIKTEAGVREAVQLTPEEQAASDAYERSAANLAELRQEIARTKDPAARQVLEAELAKQTEAAARAGQGAVAESAARSPDVVDAARVKVLQETVQRSLPEEPEAHPRLMEAIDDLAAGRTPRVPDFIPPAEREANLMAWFADSKIADESGRPMVMYRGTANPDAQAYPGGLVFLTQRPDFASVYASGRDGGAVFPVYVKASDVFDASRGEGYKLWRQYTQETGAASWASTGTERGALPTWQQEPQLRQWLASKGMNPDGIWFAESNGTASLAVRDVGQLKSATGNSGRFDPNSASLTDPLDAAPPIRPDAATTPQAADPEAAAPARGAGDDAPPGVPEPGRAAADVQAAGVAVARQERQIVEALAAERPDMMVTLPGTNEAVSLADALEMIRAQQALGESDAQLLQAAVLCDLSP